MYSYLKGSNLKNLILHSRDNNFPIKISLVISNNKKANGINYAKKYNIPYTFINTKFQNYENKILLNLRNIKFLYLFSRIYENNFKLFS